MPFRQTDRPILARFRADERGAVAMWLALLLVPILGFTYAAIEYSELAAERTGMVDAMDASALALARQYEAIGSGACAIAGADETDTTSVEGQEKAKLIRYGREFFEQSYPEHARLYRDADLTTRFDVAADLTFSMTCSTVRAAATAYTDMGGILATFFGVRSVPLDLDVEISLPGTGSVEIALVLDVTGSMSWDSCPSSTPNCASAGTPRIDALRSAVKTMLDDPNMFGTDPNAIKDNIRVSVVPFASAVNVGATYAGSSFDGAATDSVANWMDGWGGAAPAAKYHGAGLIHAEEDLARIAWTNTYNERVRVCYFFFCWYENVIGTAAHDYPTITVGTQTVNHFDLFRSVSADGTTWKGCVEALPFPLDETDFAAGAAPPAVFYTNTFVKPDLGVTFSERMNEAWKEMRADPTGGSGLTAGDTMFVPYFWRDRVDCFNGACSFVANLDSSTKGFSPNGSSSAYPAALYQDTPYSQADDNWEFVPDEWFTDPWGGVSTKDDRDRYRMLMLNMHRHGQMNPSLHGPNTMTNCLVGDQGTPAALPYVKQQALLDAMKALGIRDCTADEYLLRSAYVGVRKSLGEPYVGRYNLATYDETRDAPTSDAMGFTGPNAQCGGPLLPLTNTKADLVARIDALTPNGYTNTAVGLVWGWRTLSPQAPFVQGADPSEADGRRWRKYVVLMTDGDNTFNTPGSGSDARKSQDISDYGPYGFASEDRLGILGKGTAEFTTSPDEVSAAYARELDNKTIRMCHRMLAQGIKVYTVGFAIEKDSNADKMLAACAVDTDAYFLASNASELTQAFADITSQVVDLYVSN